MHATEEKKRPRRKMRPGDWVNASAILVIGMFLGIAAYMLIPLAGTEFWPSAVFSVGIFTALFVAMLLLDKLENIIFPDRIRPAKAEREAGKPIALLMSMPVGGFIGFLLGWLDLARPLLDLLP